MWLRILVYYIRFIHINGSGQIPIFQVTGNTPLMYAAMENRTVLIERMIEMGCDIHAKNKEHYTTLHLASMYSREDTVKLLLSKKADPSVSGGVRIRISNHFWKTKKTIFENHNWWLIDFQSRYALSNKKWFKFKVIIQKCFFCTFFQPKNQSCVHLVCSRPTSHALQILRALLSGSPKDIRLRKDLVSAFLSKKPCKP